MNDQVKTSKRCYTIALGHNSDKLLQQLCSLNNVSFSAHSTNTVSLPVTPSENVIFTIPAMAISPNYNLIRKTKGNALTRAHYNKSNCIILVYDVCSAATYEVAQRYYDQFEKNKQNMRRPDDVLLVLVGYKMGSYKAWNRSVKKEDADKMCMLNGIWYFEVSSTDKSTQELFRWIGHKINTQQQQPPKRARSPSTYMFTTPKAEAAAADTVDTPVSARGGFQTFGLSMADLLVETEEKEKEKEMLLEYEATVRDLQHTLLMNEKEIMSLQLEAETYTRQQQNDGLGSKHRASVSNEDDGDALGFGLSIGARPRAESMCKDQKAKPQFKKARTSTFSGWFGAEKVEKVEEQQAQLARLEQNVTELQCMNDSMETLYNKQRKEIQHLQNVIKSKDEEIKSQTDYAQQVEKKIASFKRDKKHWHSKFKDEEGKCNELRLAKLEKSKKIKALQKEIKTQQSGSAGDNNSDGIKRIVGAQAQKMEFTNEAEVIRGFQALRNNQFKNLVDGVMDKEEEIMEDSEDEQEIETDDDDANIMMSDERETRYKRKACHIAFGILMDCYDALKPTSMSAPKNEKVNKTSEENDEEKLNKIWTEVQNKHANKFEKWFGNNHDDNADDDDDFRSLFVAYTRECLLICKCLHKFHLQLFPSQFISGEKETGALLRVKRSADDNAYGNKLEDYDNVLQRDRTIGDTPFVADDMRLPEWCCSFPGIVDVQQYHKMMLHMINHKQTHLHGEYAELKMNFKTPAFVFQ